MRIWGDTWIGESALGVDSGPCNRNGIPYITHMLLAVDIGNTNIVVGFYAGDKLINSLRFATDHGRTADESALVLHQYMQMKGLSGIDGIIIATVVPRLDPIFRKMSREHFSLEPMVVHSGMKFNITFEYPTPTEIGTDRICNSVAAFRQFGGPCIVVDFGTATTFDVISKHGAYLGGVIAPGIETAQSALAHRAAQLFKISFEPPKSPIGKTTEEAMKAGFYLGGVGQVEYIIEKLAQELGAKPKVVATGGLASLIAPASQYITEVLPDITLEGLRLIYEMNR